METTFNLIDFLEAQSKPQTKKQYKNGINRFSKWFGASPEVILQMRQDDLTMRPGENQVDFLNRASRFERELVRYHSQAIDRKISKNSARTYTIGIMQLFRHYKMPMLLDNSQKKISKTVKTSRSFPLTIDHVRKMFKIADLRERVILSLATDLGLRISDFISLKIDDIPSLEQEPPISIEIMTKKEDVIAEGFLSGETVELMNTYIPTLNKEVNPYIFPNTNGNHISDVWLNELIQRLAVNSGIPLNGKAFTFHCFRKMLLSASVNSGIGVTAGKMLCGKSITQSDDTYLTTVKLRELFIQLKKLLTIQSQNTQFPETIESLKDTISDLQSKLENQQNIISSHTQKIDKMESVLKYTNISKEDFDKFSNLENSIKNLNFEQYPEFRTELLKKLSEQSSIAIEQLLDKFDQIRK